MPDETFVFENPDGTLACTVDGNPVEMTQAARDACCCKPYAIYITGGHSFRRNGDGSYRYSEHLSQPGTCAGGPPDPNPNGYLAGYQQYGCEEWIRNWAPGDPMAVGIQDSAPGHGVTYSLVASVCTVIDNTFALQDNAYSNVLEIVVRRKSDNALMGSFHQSTSGDPAAAPSISWDVATDFDGVCHNPISSYWMGCSQVDCNPLP